MTPEIVARVCVEILINAVLTFSKNVKMKMKVSVEKRMRFTLLLSGVASHHQKITGNTGNTQGARTESMPETNEIIMINICKRRY